MAPYDNPPYYLTAYSLAVKRGFYGTQDEWLASLKGDKVELRYLEDKIQWRWIPNAGTPDMSAEDAEDSYAWHDLVDIADTWGQRFRETLEGAQQSAEEAKEQAAAAAESARSIDADEIWRAIDNQDAKSEETKDYIDGLTYIAQATASTDITIGGISVPVHFVKWGKVVTMTLGTTATSGMSPTTGGATIQIPAGFTVQADLVTGERTIAALCGRGGYNTSLIGALSIVAKDQIRIYWSGASVAENWTIGATLTWITELKTIGGNEK